MTKSKGFSEREELTSPPALQRETIDLPLRNGLLNCIVDALGRSWAFGSRPGDGSLDRVCRELWRDHFQRYEADFPAKKTQLGHNVGALDSHIVEYVRNEARPWYCTYDLIEAICLGLRKHVPRDADRFSKACNGVLEKHNAAWRFVGDQITPIYSEDDHDAVEAALGNARVPDNAREHVRRALRHLKPGRDSYSDAAHQAIDSVEALAQEITGMHNKTLGDILRTSDLVPKHSAARKALEGLWGWASDTEIRHAKKPGAEPIDQADAVFLAVTCSAILNYLTAKRAAA